MDSRVNLREITRHWDGTVQKSEMSFQDFLQLFVQEPELVARDVFQAFRDMLEHFIGPAQPPVDDPHFLGLVNWDYTELFVKGVDHPYHPDYFFANHLKKIGRKLVGRPQNVIYIFEGPPGAGKSIFLNNLLGKFEEYVNSPPGCLYEMFWRTDSLTEILGGQTNLSLAERQGPVSIPCPSHDHPLVIVPKIYRFQLLEALELPPEFREKLFSQREYEWVLNREACPFCASLYQALFARKQDHERVLNAVSVRRRRINRRLGQGIVVWNAGDQPVKGGVFRDRYVQETLGRLFNNIVEVRYVFSKFAGALVCALMDIKDHNVDRLMELHNVISEGVYKVESMEEGVNALFMAVMNPEDKKNIKNMASLKDRAEWEQLPLVRDHVTETKILRSIFGEKIRERFSPRVLEDFARIIVSTRLNLVSEALNMWIGDAKEYELVCDKHLLLLKMEIYKGERVGEGGRQHYLPTWLKEGHKKSFTKLVRNMFIEESAKEGKGGFTDRDSPRMLRELLNSIDEYKRVSINDVLTYFTETLDAAERKKVSNDLLVGVLKQYNYLTLEEIKSALYDPNEAQIAQDIQRYLYATTVEVGDTVYCPFTEDEFTVTIDFLEMMERRILRQGANAQQRLSLRQWTADKLSQVFAQEISIEGKHITDTSLYQELRDKYMHQLKETVLDPFIQNANFKRAIKAYGADEFKTYDERIQREVTFLIENLVEKYGYTKEGAQDICVYTIDRNLVKEFEGK